ncbi:MAG TPA: cob(I)yrinic acid a,c-diamide adenosyltransferase [Bacteroides sp.]|nr:cob(I)yrinic acid a,c-diamide adenosyltransferase [Bacteroides sp.]
MAKKSDIYTRKGDKGETSLLGGKRVPKFHPRIRAYGSVDELMAQTAMLRDLLEDASLRADLLEILYIQMATASVLAADCEDCPVMLPEVGAAQVRFLENRIDQMDASLKPLTSFLIPGGHPAVSQAHIARTVCRRTEREILELAREASVDEEILRFYNRLSDYFFVLSRKIAHLVGIEQKPWDPKL